MYINFKKSHLGQSANQILKTARVVQMRSGDYQVIVDTNDLIDLIAIQTEHGNLVLDNSTDKIGIICGPSAQKKLETLICEAEQKTIAYLKSEDIKNSTSYATNL